MDQVQAIKKLIEQDKKCRYVFNTSTLKRIFEYEHDKPLMGLLERLVGNGVLTRACRGIYVYNFSYCDQSRVIEWIAAMLRPGEANYIGGYSALNRNDCLEPKPESWLQVFSSGRDGLYETSYGNIEIYHCEKAHSIASQSFRAKDSAMAIASGEQLKASLEKVRKGNKSKNSFQRLNQADGLDDSGHGE